MERNELDEWEIEVLEAFQEMRKLVRDSARKNKKRYGRAKSNRSMIVDFNVHPGINSDVQTVDIQFVTRGYGRGFAK